MTAVKTERIAFILCDEVLLKDPWCIPEAGLRIPGFIIQIDKINLMRDVFGLQDLQDTCRGMLANHCITNALPSLTVSKPVQRSPTKNADL